MLVTVPRAVLGSSADPPETPRELESALCRQRKEHHTTFRKAALLHAYTMLVGRGELDACASLHGLLVKKSSKSQSGVLVITVLGLLEAFPALFANRNKAAVNMPKAQELNPIMRSTGPANSVSASFRSASEPFFKPMVGKSKSMSANEFLYGAKIAAPPLRRATSLRRERSSRKL